MYLFKNWFRMGKEISGCDDSKSFFLDSVKFVICIKLIPP